MSNAVLISIRPKWCELIASGQKTIEVRKNRPKLDTPFKCYIYCTSVKPMNLEQYCAIHAKTNGSVDDWSGKVIGEFVCDGIETIECSSDAHNRYAKESCLKLDDFIKYCNGHDLFGWHISALQIYDKPREPSDFTKFRYDSQMPCCRINRPFQSWGYVEELT